jgi:lipopolysaccharide export system permease protein
MNLMLNKLDKYLIHQFWTILGISVFGFVSIFLVVDLIENLDRFMDNQVPFLIVLKYYVYTLPYFISIGLPMSVLLSTVFSLGNMVKKNEWTAMKASGISLYRITLTLLLCGLFLSGASFTLDNMFVSIGNEKRFEIDRDYVKRKSRHKLKNTLSNIFLQKNSSNHIALAKYSIKKETGSDLTIIDLGTDIMRKRIDAKKITWNSDSIKWSVKDYSIRDFNDQGIENNVLLGTRDTLLDLGFTPQEIQQQARKPDELDFFKLSERIIQLKSNGVDTIRWEVTRYLKISFAFTNLIVVLFGIPLVLVKEENSLSFGAGASVFVIFGYYAFIKFGQSLGFKGVMEPMLSAWIGNIVFMIGGLILLYRAKT